MKKSLGAALVIFLSLIGAKAFASDLEVKILKAKIESNDGTQPGGNRVTPNGLKKSKDFES